MIDITRHAETLYQIVSKSYNFGIQQIINSDREIHTFHFPIIVDGRETKIVVETNLVSNYTICYLNGMEDGRLVDLKAYLTLDDKFLIQAEWRGASIKEIIYPSGPKLVIKYFSDAFLNYKFAHAQGMTQEEFDHLMVTARLMMDSK